MEELLAAEDVRLDLQGSWTCHRGGGQGVRAEQEGGCFPTKALPVRALSGEQGRVERST